MNRDELIEQIVKNIRDLGIDFRANSHLEGLSAVINVKRGQGAYNPLVVTPFHLVHGMFHVMNQDCSRKCDYDIHNPAEKIANKSAIQWLWEEFMSLDGTEEYFHSFLEITGCPLDLSRTIINEMMMY